MLMAGLMQLRTMVANPVCTQVFQKSACSERPSVVFAMWSDESVRSVPPAGVLELDGHAQLDGLDREAGWAGAAVQPVREVRVVAGVPDLCAACRGRTPSQQDG